MKSKKQLIDEKLKLIADNRKLLNASAGKLNTEQQAEYDKREADIERLSTEIEEYAAHESRAEKLAKIEGELSESTGRQTSASNVSEGESLTFDFGRAGQVSLNAGSPAAQMAGKKYGDAFASYLRGESRNYESLGLKVGDDSKGGYLAPVAFVSRLIKFLDDAVFIRQLATVLPPTMAKTVGAVSFDTDYADADWTAEVQASDISEDDAARFGKRELTPHLLTKLVKTSLKLARSSSIDIMSFVAQRMAYRFALPEEKGYLTGSGAQQPLGVFTASDQGITTSQDVRTSSQTDFVYDDLIDCLYDLKDGHVASATWVGSREFRKRCRKLKDGEGRYILVENQNGGTVTTLLDRPLRVSEFAPSTFTASQYVAVVGNFEHYWIQDGMGLEMQNLLELFALKNQIGWVGRKETDGMPVLAEAFRRLQMKAS